jgi:hypothetical protein
VDEHNLVVERLNGFEVTRATLMQTVVSGAFSKKGIELFKKQIASINIKTAAKRRPEQVEGGDGAQGR